MIFFCMNMPTDIWHVFMFLQESCYGQLLFYSIIVTLSFMKGPNGEESLPPLDFPPRSDTLSVARVLPCSVTE